MTCISVVIAATVLFFRLFPSILHSFFPSSSIFLRPFSSVLQFGKGGKVVIEMRAWQFGITLSDLITLIQCDISLSLSFFHSLFPSFRLIRLRIFFAQYWIATRHRRHWIENGRNCSKCFSMFDITVVFTAWVPTGMWSYKTVHAFKERNIADDIISFKNNIN